MIFKRKKWCNLINIAKNNMEYRRYSTHCFSRRLRSLWLSYFTLTHWLLGILEYTSTAWGLRTMGSIVLLYVFMTSFWV